MTSYQPLLIQPANMSNPGPHKPCASAGSQPSGSNRGEEQRMYIQTANMGVGDYVIDVRDVPHTQVPRLPSEPFRTASGSIAAEIADSVRQPALVPTGASKYGHEKGSYLSPFDYNIREIRGKNKRTNRPTSLTSPLPIHDSLPQGSLPAHNHSSSFTNMSSRSNMPPRSTMYQANNMYPAQASGIPVYEPYRSMYETTLPAHDMIPAIMSQPETPSETDSLTKHRAVTPGADAKERLLLIAPLKMIRASGPRLIPHDQELLFDFLDKYMAEELHTVVERDAVFPNLVYKVGIPMTDENWKKYNQVLTVFGFANGVHEMLAVGAEIFNQDVHGYDQHTGEKLVNPKTTVTIPQGTVTYPHGSGNYPSGTSNYAGGNGSYTGGSSNYAGGSGPYLGGTGFYPNSASNRNIELSRNMGLGWMRK
ncbi:carbohydrate-binding module family 35 [Pyrenophora seminiperda CCB06]|uniref:Carbohydrate-binding module family 35 n=1 Tax=Pyrenophora seminiperda CCB06 TaxID=1302712 RepID=A0A3M7MHR6_9PLEO|nr:carbohydrate-binding module family 35 [Pyrenophora seminiperda CCB06]